MSNDLNLEKEIVLDPETSCSAVKPEMGTALDPVTLAALDTDMRVGWHHKMRNAPDPGKRPALYLESRSDHDFEMRNALDSE